MNNSQILQAYDISKNSFGYETNDSIYIFKQGNTSILASSDDELQPIIGTFVGDYNLNDMPENFREILEHYAEEIETYQSNPNAIEFDQTEATYKSNWITINPLLPYTFGQTAPYSNDLKLEDTLSTSATYGKNVQVVTGCNNTALSQIIAYWGCIGINGVKYRVGCNKTTAHSSKKTKTNSDGSTTITEQYSCPSLPAISSFDYDNIVEHYTNYYNESGATIKVSAPTATQKAAVAQLMKYIGFTCYSTYGKSSTGTYPSDSRTYCTNFYFHADSKYTTTKTDFDTNEAFEKAIYNELINRRPIFFCGYKSVYNSKTQKYSANGGHAFNCDGYNASTDKYHFNWGWNGKYNGWFSITALNPSAPSSTATQNGYNYSKLVLTNFYPTKFMEDVVNGDFNGDGTIDIKDVLFFTNLVDTDNVIPAYDRNKDGYVNIKDVSDIVSKLDIATNKTYALSINGSNLFTDENPNDVNYEHTRININKTSKKVEIITKKNVNSNVSQTSKTIALPTISNPKTNLNTFINTKSASVKNKFNTYINRSSNDELNNAFVYLKNHRSEYVSKAAPSDIVNSQLVDLGLSVKWASTNVGAINPEDAGDYYAWGEVTTKTSYTWSTYQYYNSTSQTASTLGSSIAKSNTFDKAFILDRTMCMPTEAQWRELINNCTWTKRTKNNKPVWEIKGKNGNIIYLPVNGCKSESSSVSYVDYAYYWTSNYYADNSLQARTFRATDTPGFFTMYRRTGAGIRAVSV
jgi:hypothetical protein